MRFALAFLIYCAVGVAQMPDLNGDWVVTAVRFGEPDYTRLHLETKNGHYIGKIWGDVQLDGVLKAGAVEFQCTYEEDKQQKSCGSLSLSLSGKEMKGQGKLFDEPVSVSAKRETIRSEAPRTHEFVPTHFYRQFSGATEPVLHINPRDTVHTKCVDAGGVDEKGEHRSMGGNPLTGPFFVEGAVPGDTLVVRLNRVRLSRDSAGIYNDTVVGSAVDPYYFRDLKRVKDFDSSWKLDRTAQTAMLAKPTDRLKDFKVHLHPMLGCVGALAPQAAKPFAPAISGTMAATWITTNFGRAPRYTCPCSNQAHCCLSAMATQARRRRVDRQRA